MTRAVIVFIIRQLRKIMSINANYNIIIPVETTSVIYNTFDLSYIFSTIIIGKAIKFNLSSHSQKCVNSHPNKL